jgi:hypothetical protein
MKISYLLIFGILIPIFSYSVAPNPLTGTLFSVPGFVFIYWYIRNKMDEKDVEKYVQHYATRSEYMSEEEMKIEDFGELKTKIVCVHCQTAGFIRSKQVTAKPSYLYTCGNCKLVYSPDNPGEFRQL